MGTVRIALSQFNCCVGDITGNTERIISDISRARNEGADIVCFPELAVTGYPPEDLLFKPRFIKRNLEALEKIREATDSVTAIIGFVDRDSDIYNAAAVLQNKKLIDVHRKIYLPNYGVFDENRYFLPGNECSVFRYGDATFGVSICEDIWYPGDPMKTQVISGKAQFIINISSSPFYKKKPVRREQMLRTRASDYSAAVIFCNLVGGQDELIFDGNSAVINERGELIARAKGFEEDFLIAEIDLEKIFQSRLSDSRGRKENLNDGNGINLKVRELERTGSADGRKSPDHVVHTMYSGIEEVYRALVLGTKDYVSKNGFEKVVIGASGGIDSALVLAIAADALGSENVYGVTMPSQYSSRGSVTDSETLCSNLGVELVTIPIKSIFNTYLESLEGIFSGRDHDTTEENIQARIRGNLLMALSNKFGWLVLTTGNKSEMSVGYSTLYGDMAGGFAVLKDVHKTMVYELSKYFNRLKGKEIIPEAILAKPPSAELSPGQKDSDTLPEYEVLDRILERYIEEDMSAGEIIDRGEDPDLVNSIIRMVDHNEYKRRQSPPGIKITTKAFGKDRRLPITNRYRG